MDLILDLVGGQALRDVADVIEYGLVDPHVSALYPLQCSGEAIAAVENGHATGKVVIEMSQA